MWLFAPTFLVSLLISFHNFLSLRYRILPFCDHIRHLGPS